MKLTGEEMRNEEKEGKEEEKTTPFAANSHAGQAP